MTAVAQSNPSLTLPAAPRQAGLLRNLVVNWAGWIIFVVALIRVPWVISMSNELRWIDEREYSAIAKGLAAGKGYVSTSFRANPVLPAYMAAGYTIFGERHLPLRVGQAVLGALSCVVVLRAASVVAGPVAGFIAGLGTALYPPYVYLSGIFYVDCLLVFLLSVATWLAVIAPARRGSWKLALLTGIVLGAVALTRSVFLAAVPAVACAWLLANHLPFSRRAALCGLMSLGVLATIVPWSVRNYGVFGRFVPISSGLYTKLWQGNNELANGGPGDRELFWNDHDLGGWEKRLSGKDELTRREIREKYAAVETRVQQQLAVNPDYFLATDTVLADVAKSWIVEHPWSALRLAGAKLLTLYSAYSDTLTEDSQSVGRKRLLAGVSFYPVLLLGLTGMLLALPRWRAFGVFFLLPAFVTAAYCLLNTCTRFRLPLDMFLIIFASVAIAKMLPSHLASTPDNGSR